MCTFSRSEPHMGRCMGGVPAGFRLGSSGDPHGFQGVNYGFHIIWTPFFVGVPLRPTPPCIILIRVYEWKRTLRNPEPETREDHADNVGEGRKVQRWQLQGVLEVLEFYRALVLHLQSCFVKARILALHCQNELQKGPWRF